MRMKDDNNNKKLCRNQNGAEELTDQNSDHGRRSSKSWDMLERKVVR